MLCSLRFVFVLVGCVIVFAFVTLIESLAFVGYLLWWWINCLLYLIGLCLVIVWLLCCIDVLMYLLIVLLWIAYFKFVCFSCLFVSFSCLLVACWFTYSLCVVYYDAFDLRLWCLITVCCMVDSLFTLLIA